MVVADLAFLHKYVKRGVGLHSATCFCLFCGALRNFRHHGYPGGCRKCRLFGATAYRNAVTMNHVRLSFFVAIGKVCRISPACAGISPHVTASMGRCGSTAK